jgi:hypothetical protein
MKRVRATVVALQKSVLHSLNVSAALFIQQAMRKPKIVICGLPDFTKFFTLSHKRNDPPPKGKL